MQLATAPAQPVDEQRHQDEEQQDCGCTANGKRRVAGAPVPRGRLRADLFATLPLCKVIDPGEKRGRKGSYRRHWNGRVGATKGDDIFGLGHKQRKAHADCQAKQQSFHLSSIFNVNAMSMEDTDKSRVDEAFYVRLFRHRRIHVYMYDSPQLTQHDIIQSRARRIKTLDWIIA